MRKTDKVLFAAMGMLACSLQINAQSCNELFQKANSLRDSKKYAEAINYYQRAKDCDPDLRTDCNRWMKYCRKMAGTSPVLEISEQEIVIPYQGGDKQIEIKSSGKWEIDGTTEWCNTDAFDSKNFVIQCRDANNSTRSKTTTLVVKSGSLYKSIKVVQEGRPEYIEVGAQSLAFPASGTEDDITIESNANWDVTSTPSWCKVEKKDGGIRIIVSPNDRVMERTDDIVIVSPSKSVTIKIYQSAGDEHLTLSQNNLVFNAEGDVHYMKIYTDADNWFIGDYPTWMNVQKVGSDSIRIECGKNLPNGEYRSGSVQVKTDRQTAGVMVTQAPRMAQDLIFPNSRLVGGRNFSLGVSASYNIPFVSASAGGEYVGSVLDYGLGTSSENASYKSATGYSFGLFADIRLYKNIFLTAGVNFSQVKYKNEFNKNTTLTLPLSTYQCLRGEVQNAYTEDYTFTRLEVPVLASYRFKVSDVSHVQLNFGPVFYLDLSAKMKVSGNTSSNTLHVYSVNPPYGLINSSNYSRQTAVDAEFNLHQPCVAWTMNYTEGNDAGVDHHDQFQTAPFKKFNCGLRIGAAYEWAGIAFGLSYTYMLNNMANKNYWDNERWTVLNNSDVTMQGYKHRINSLEFKLSYTFRYIKSKK